MILDDISFSVQPGELVGIIGSKGAGIGILVPTKNPYPTPDEEACNSLLSALRAPAEREGAIIEDRKSVV